MATVRCWWCDLAISPEAALIDRRTGRVKCRPCADYDKRREALELTNGP